MKKGDLCISDNTQFAILKVMKLRSYILLAFALMLSGLFYASETYALSVSNVGYKFCHYGPMDSKWGRNPKTDPWHGYWLCDARTSSNQSKVTIFWEADQISDNFYVEYSTDRGATYIKSPSGILNPKPLKYMWEFNALPSKTYYFRIRSQSMGNTDLYLLNDIRTNIAQGSVKYVDGLRVDFDVEYLNGALRWQSYGFHNGRGGGCQTGNFDWRSGNFDCVVGGANPPMTLTRFNDWFLENKGDHIYVSTLGAHEYDDGDSDDTSTAFLTMYAPGPPPFEVEGSVTVPISVTQGGDAVVFPVQIKNISEGGVNVPGGAAVPKVVQLSFPKQPAGLTISAAGSSSCTPPQTSGQICSPDLQASVAASLQAILGTQEVVGEVNGRRFTFAINVEKPKPKIVIQSTQLDDTRIYRETILSGQAPSTPLVFSVLNSTEGSTLDFRVSSDVSWLSLGSTAERLEYLPGSNTPPLSKPITVTLRTERLPLQSHRGTITIADVYDPTIKAEIVVELTVTNTYDFSFSVTSPSVLVQGNSVGAKVVVTRTTGVASDVALSVSGLPTGVTGVFVPAVCSAAVLASSCTSVLTLSADTSAALGPKTVTITAKKSLDQNGPAREQKKTFTLTVSKSFGVSLAVSPASLQIAERGTGSVRVLATITAQGGKEVAFETQGLPAGTTGTFTPVSCAQTCTATFSINAGSAAPGISSVSIRAVGSGGTSVTGSLSLIIKPTTTPSPRPTVTGKPGPTQIPVTPRPTVVQPPGGGGPGGGEEPDPISFNLVTVRTLSVIQGSMTNTSVILSYEGGDPEAVRIAASQLPKNTDASLSLTQCVPSCYAVLTIRTKNTTPLGSANVKITASSRGLVRTSFIELIVGTDPPPAPTALLQKNVKDGVQVGVGGTVREDRIVFSGTLDNMSAQKVRLRVEAKPVKEFFNGVTGVFEEPTRLTEKGSSYELTGSKLLGGYKWRAQTVDERGIASPWAEFGRNSDSESDFITDLSTPPINPFEANQGDSQVEEQPGFFRRILGWVCYIPLVGRMCS